MPNHFSEHQWERTIVAFASPYSLKDLCDLESSVATNKIPSYKIRMASTDNRISVANELVRKKYAWRGYEFEGLVRQPNYVTLIILLDENLIATMTLGIDSERGLSADEAYKKELDDLRAKNRKISEITKYAIEDGFGSMQIQASIIHITYIFARYVHSCTDFVIEVNPRHIRFYKEYLGFHILGQEKYCKRVNAHSQLMHIELDYMAKKIEQLAGTGGGKLKRGEKSLYPYFFYKTDENGIAARLVK